MSEEKNKMDELCDKFSKVIAEVIGIEVDKNSDKLIDATNEFSEAVEKFTKKLDKIDNKYKAYIGCEVIINVSFAGEQKICVVGGSRRHITKVLDEIKERINK